LNQPQADQPNQTNSCSSSDATTKADAAEPMQQLAAADPQPQTQPKPNAANDRDSQCQIQLNQTHSVATAADATTKQICEANAIVQAAAAGCNQLASRRSQSNAQR
jgi:hypothetical protein